MTCCLGCAADPRKRAHAASLWRAVQPFARGARLGFGGSGEGLALVDVADVDVGSGGAGVGGGGGGGVGLCEAGGEGAG